MQTLPPGCSQDHLSNPHPKPCGMSDATEPCAQGPSLSVIPAEPLWVLEVLVKVIPLWVLDHHASVSPTGSSCSLCEIRTRMTHAESSECLQRWHYCFHTTSVQSLAPGKHEIKTKMKSCPHVMGSFEPSSPPSPLFCLVSHRPPVSEPNCS